jgi:hypothetical protein
MLLAFELHFVAPSFEDINLRGIQFGAADIRDWQFNLKFRVC